VLTETCSLLVDMHAPKCIFILSKPIVLQCMCLDPKLKYIGWRKAHPAGDHWIDWYDGRDATEVMDGFHSAKALQMYKRLPKSKADVVPLLVEQAVPDSSTQIAFRKLRAELEADGWWEREMGVEYRIVGIWATLVVGAASLASSLPVLSSFLLGLSMTAAGWLGHDFIHGVDTYTDKMRNFAAFAAGLAPTWWSDKHNKHHALSKYSSKLLYHRGIIII
jgi:hypothetical protein